VFWAPVICCLDMGMIMGNVGQQDDG